MISGSGDWICGDDEEWHVRSNPNSVFANDNLPVCRPRKNIFCAVVINTERGLS